MNETAATSRGTTQSKVMKRSCFQGDVSHTIAGVKNETAATLLTLCTLDQIANLDAQTSVIHLFIQYMIHWTFLMMNLMIHYDKQQPITAIATARNSGIQGRDRGAPKQRKFGRSSEQQAVSGGATFTLTGRGRGRG
jgi:hypothetical protein